MSRTSLGLLGIIVLASACSSESGGGPAVTVRDSAGISIVENAVRGGVVPVYGELGEADLEVGVVDGDPAYSFRSVIDVRTLPDGDIIVVEGGPPGGVQELRVFDSGGRHVSTIGRQGEGPGEFRMLAPLAGLAQDTIWTWDSRLSRLTWFSTDGELLGDMHVDVGTRVMELTRLSDGTYLADLPHQGVRFGDGSHVASARLWKLDAEGELLDSLQNVGGTDVQVSRARGRRGGPVISVLEPPFGRFPAYATGADRFYTGWNGEYRVIARSLAGDPIMMVSAPALERPVDPAEVSAVRARWVDRCSDDECQRRLNRMFDDLQLPQQRPAFSALKVDGRGNLWVAEYDPNGNVAVGWQASGWQVFSPEGELLGRVATPPGLTVHEIGADYLLGVQENELDVPFVRRFPLSRLD